jgi:centromeric protein E
VYRGECPTRQVYEDGPKEVALSVVKGINSSIFAYGQTSSGKTYTMSGITEFAVADIFDYIFKHEDRAFVVKFSAIEIYNEAIRDLLSPDSTPLRLRDDPEVKDFFFSPYCEFFLLIMLCDSLLVFFFFFHLERGRR